MFQEVENCSLRKDATQPHTCTHVVEMHTLAPMVHGSRGGFVQGNGLHDLMHPWTRELMVPSYCHPDPWWRWPVSGASPVLCLVASLFLPPVHPPPQHTINYYFSSETFQSLLTAAAVQCKEKTKQKQKKPKHQTYCLFCFSEVIGFESGIAFTYSEIIASRSRSPCRRRVAWWPHCTRTNVPSWPEVRSSISQSPCGSPMGSKPGGSMAKCGGRGVAAGRDAVAVLMCRWVSKRWAAEDTGETPAWRRWGGSSGPGPSPSSFWSPDTRRALSQGARTSGTEGSWGACWQLGGAAGWCCNCSNLEGQEERGNSHCQLRALLS